MAKKKTTKKKTTKKQASKKKTTRKKTAKKKRASEKVDPIEQAKLELRESVKNAVKAFAHIANAAEKEAIDGLLSVAPDSSKTRTKLVQRKKTLEEGDTESIAGDILTQIRGALKSHNIDLGGITNKPSKTGKSKAD